MRLTLVSSLFNYPSHGGGMADTIAVGRALQRAGIEVSHVYARNLSWPTGTLQGEAPFPGMAVDFTGPDLGRRIRAAVDSLSPDAVLVTDSWSSKAARALSVNNHLVVEWLGDYGKKAIVVGSGFDPAVYRNVTPVPRGERPVVFMAGDVADPIKGYSILLTQSQDYNLRGSRSYFQDARGYRSPQASRGGRQGWQKKERDQEKTYWTGTGCSG